jgi:hypothetical protein
MKFNIILLFAGALLFPLAVQAAPDNAQTTAAVKERKTQMAKAIPYIEDAASGCLGVMDEGKLSDLGSNITASGWMNGIGGLVGGSATVIGSSISLASKDDANKQGTARLVANIGSGVSTVGHGVATGTSASASNTVEELIENYKKCAEKLGRIEPMTSWSCVYTDAINTACDKKSPF